MQENTVEENVEKKNTPSADAVDYQKVLELALEIGAGLLANGGSVSRVETAVDKICTAYGAAEVEVASFSSIIIASMKLADGRAFSLMKRVYSTSNNLAMLEKFNQLSRDVCRDKTPVDDALYACFNLKCDNPRKKWVTVVGAGLVSATYAVFFGGTVADCLPAFIVAVIMAGLNEVLSVRSLNAYATTFLLSFIGGLLCVSLCKFFVICGMVCHGSLVTVGTIMILIPGLLITNAVRDLFTGDLMSGTFQILNGLLLTLVIAAGYGAAMMLLSDIADFIPAETRTGVSYYLYFVISGTLSAVAVCIFFNFDPKHLVWALISTVPTFGIYLLVELIDGSNPFFSTFAATLFAALLSEILARVVKSPSTIFLIPAIISYVPGSSLYYTVEAIVNGNTEVAASKGIVCLMILLGIAVGICVVTVLFQFINPIKNKHDNKNKLALLRKAEKYKDD